eukprot:11111725-Prorocentrum_lima.AAC.1
MTSSLVGSEMCIRDRSRSNSPTLRNVPDLPMEHGTSGVEIIPSTQPPPCLLYTSDAADDM